MDDQDIATMKEAIKEVIKKNSCHLSEKDLSYQEDLLTKVHIDGKKPYEAMGVPKEMIEYLYMNAYNLYNNGKYEDAKRIFYILETFDPKDSRFIYGIAASYHMEKKYPLAIYNYMKCLYFPPVSPMTYFHLADCYYKMGGKREAVIMLKTAIRKAETTGGYDAMKERAQQELNKLIDDINNEVEETSPQEAKKG